MNDKMDDKMEGQILVIGIGNQLMMDDGIGVYTVEALKSQCTNLNINSNTKYNIQYIIGETDVYYCLGEMEKADFTIIIDAAHLGLKPCSVNTYLLKDILHELPAAPSFHDLNLIQAMKLHNFQAQGVLIAIEVCNVDCSFGLSHQMEKQFLNILEEIENKITKVLDIFTKNRI